MSLDGRLLVQGFSSVAAADRWTLRFSGVAMPGLVDDVREYLVVYGCVRALMTAVVAVTVAVRDTSRPSLLGRRVKIKGCCRHPKAKYEIGGTPAR